LKYVAFWYSIKVEGFGMKSCQILNIGIIPIKTKTQKNKKQNFTKNTITKFLKGLKVCHEQINQRKFFFGQYILQKKGIKSKLLCFSSVCGSDMN